MKRRITYLFLSVVCFAACVIIVKVFSGSGIIRGFTGDIIVIGVVYFFIKAFHEFPILKLTIFTLGIAFIIELLQYLEIAALFGLEHNMVARVVLGSVFDPLDLIAYTIGSILVYLVDTRLVSRTRIRNR